MNSTEQERTEQNINELKETLMNITDHTYTERFVQDYLDNMLDQMDLEEYLEIMSDQTGTLDINRVKSDMLMYWDEQIKSKHIEYFELLSTLNSKERDEISMICSDIYCKVGYYNAVEVIKEYKLNQ